MTSSWEMPYLFVSDEELEFNDNALIYPFPINSFSVFIKNVIQLHKYIKGKTYKHIEKIYEDFLKESKSDFKILFDKLFVITEQKLDDKILLKCCTKEPFSSSVNFFYEPSSVMAFTLCKSNRINIELIKTPSNTYAVSAVYVCDDDEDSQWTNRLKLLHKIKSFGDLANSFTNACLARTVMFLNTLNNDDAFFNWINLSVNDSSNLKESKVFTNMWSLIKQDTAFVTNSDIEDPKSESECAEIFVRYIGGWQSFTREWMKMYNHDKYSLLYQKYYEQQQKDIDKQTLRIIESNQETINSIRNSKAINQKIKEIDDNITRLQEGNQKIESNQNVFSLRQDLQNLSQQLTNDLKTFDDVRVKSEKLRDMINAVYPQKKRWNITFVLNSPKEYKITGIKFIQQFGTDPRNSTYIHEIEIQQPFWTMATSNYHNGFTVYQTNKMNVVASTTDGSVQFHTMYPSLQPLLNSPIFNQNNFVVQYDTAVPELPTLKALDVNTHKSATNVSQTKTGDQKNNPSDEEIQRFWNGEM